MIDLPRVASLIFNQAHHVTPEAAEVIMASIADRIGLDSSLRKPGIEGNAFVGRRATNRDGSWRGYRLTETGIAIVPIHGELVNRGAWLGSSSGLVSYEGLRQSLRNAASDPEARTILLDIDSPGGMVSGMIETALLVRQISAAKAVTAVANGLMASAAYGIASGAARIFAPATAEVGSIGTLYIHADRSRQLQKAGVSVTLIHAGARKVDGNPFQALPEGVRAEIQARVDYLQDLFVNAVALGRHGRINEKSVRATEARIFFGRDAVAAGLADDAHDFDGAVDMLNYAVRYHRKAGTVLDPRDTPGPTRSAVVCASGYDAAAGVAVAARAARLTQLVARPASSPPKPAGTLTARMKARFSGTTRKRGALS